MKLFKKSTAPINTPARIKNMNESELMSWGGVLLMHLGASYDAWMFHGKDISEAKANAETFISILEELEKRANDRRS